MKKRLLAALLSAMLLTTALAGCGDGGSTSGDNSEGSNGGTEGKKVEIEFFQQKREATESFDKVIKAFQEKNQNITVKQNTVPDSGTILMTRSASDDMPDVLTHWPTDAAYVQFAKEGHLKDLTDNACMDGIKETYMADLDIDGKYYCFPFSLNFMGVYYNVDKFKEGGYEIPKTWDELINIAKDVQSKGEVAFLLPDKDTWTISQCWSNIEGKDRGGNSEIYGKLNDGSATFEGDELYVSSLEKTIELREYSQGDTLALGYDQAINDYANGKGLFFPQGNWAMPSIKAANPDGNFAMFPMPNDSGDIIQPVGVDVAICAGVNSENPEAVDAFLAFLTTPEAAGIYAENDRSPSCIEGVEVELPEFSAMMEAIEKNSVIDLVSPPAGFEETKRSMLQAVIVEKDVEGWLKDLTAAWKEASAE